MPGFISTTFNSLGAQLGNSIFAICKALILLIVAVIIANLVSAGVKKVLKKTGLAALSMDEKTGETSVDYIAKAAKLLTLLFFVPAIFVTLGITAAAQPLQSFMNKFFMFIPNLIGACILFAIGYMVAKLVRQLLIPLFRKCRLDVLQEKMGIEAADTSKFSEVAAYIVYVLILIPVIIATLQVLDIDSLTKPAVSMLNKIMEFIPNIIVSLLVMGVGVILSKMAAQVIKKIVSATGADAKVRELTCQENGKLVFSSVLGNVVYAVLLIFFIVEGLSVLHLDVLTRIGIAIIGYLPNVLGAIVIVMIAVFASSAAAKLLRESGMDLTARIAKAIILVLGGFMVLDQLAIAPSIVNSAFCLLVAALALAFALSFGLGGRDFASKLLNKISLDEKEEKKE